MKQIPSWRRFSRRALLGWQTILALLLTLGAARAGNLFDNEWKPPAKASHSAASEAKDRLAIPSSADQARSRTLAKEAFAQDLTDRSPQGRDGLARKLLAQGDAAGNGPSDRFVMLGGAIDAAVQADDLGVCFKAADAMGRGYDVDPLAVKAQALVTLASSGHASHSDAKAALDLLDQLTSADEFSRAFRVAAAAQALAEGDASTERSLQQERRAMESLQLAYQRAERSFDRLKTSPDDPAANLAAGKYLCFEKDRWAQGLVMLAKGSDSTLAALAKRDLSDPATAAAQFALAEDWWDAQIEPPAQRVASRQRGGYWYAKALPALAGLHKALASKRLAELGPAEKPPAAAGDAGDFSPTTNMLAQLQLPGKGATRLDDGSIQVSNGKLRTRENYNAPIRMDFIAKTDSNNIRVGFCKGQIILNWEGNPGQLRHSDPIVGNDHITPFKHAADLPVNQWVKITWFVTKHESEVFLNGKKAALVTGDFADAHGEVAIYPAIGSVIAVKYFCVTPSPPDASAPAGAGGP